MLIQINNEYIAKRPIFAKTQIAVKFDKDNGYYRYEVVGGIEFIGSDYDYINSLVGETVDGVFNYGGKNTNAPELIGKFQLGSEFNAFTKVVSLDFIVEDAYSLIDNQEDKEINIYDLLDTSYILIEQFGENDIDYIFPAHKIDLSLQNMIADLTGLECELASSDSGDFGTLLMTAMTNVILNEDGSQKEIFGTALNVSFSDLINFIYNKNKIVWNASLNSSRDKVLLNLTQIKNLGKTLVNVSDINKYLENKHKKDTSELHTLIQRKQPNEEKDIDFKGRDIEVQGVLSKKTELIEFSKSYSNLEDILLNPNNYPDSITDLLITSSRTFVEGSGNLNNSISASFERATEDLEGLEPAPVPPSYSTDGTSFEVEINDYSGRYHYIFTNGTVVNPSTSGYYNVALNYKCRLFNSLVSQSGVPFPIIQAKQVNVLILGSDGNILPETEYEILQVSGTISKLSESIYNLEFEESQTVYPEDFTKLNITIKTSSDFKIGFRFRADVQKDSFDTVYYNPMKIKFEFEDIEIKRLPYHLVTYGTFPQGEGLKLNIFASQSYADYINKNYEEYPTSSAIINNELETGLNVRKNKDIEFELPEFDMNLIDNNMLFASKLGDIEPDEIIQGVDSLGKKTIIKGRY